MSDQLTVWNRLRAGNEAFFVPIRSKPGSTPATGPIAAVFRCADAGLASEVVFCQSWGSLVDISSWGHVVDAGVLATMEYAVDTLEVPLIVVLGHDNCPAMRVALRAWTEAAIPDGSARTMVEQAVSSIVRRAARTDSIETVTSAHVVETGLSLLERSPVIARRVDEGSCGIICATTDANHGWVRTCATIGVVSEDAESLLERV